MRQWTLLRRNDSWSIPIQLFIEKKIGPFFHSANYCLIVVEGALSLSPALPFECESRAMSFRDQTVKEVPFLYSLWRNFCALINCFLFLQVQIVPRALCLRPWKLHQRSLYPWAWFVANNHRWQLSASVRLSSELCQFFNVGIIVRLLQSWRP